MALRVAKVAVSSGPDGVIARALDILAQAGKTVFPTRAAFVAWVDAGNTVPDGMVVTAAGLNYLAQTGATAIADLPGFDSPALDNPALNGTVSGTAVQSSAVDGTAGRIMLTGAFGLGGVLPLVINPNVTDNSIVPGDYRWDVSQGSVNAPAETITLGMLVHRRRAPGGGEYQSFFVESASGNIPADGTQYRRTRTSGAWPTFQIVPTPARTTISTAPLYIGQFAVVSGVPYISVGTASTADWIELALA
jgi:hypothetical protein